VAIAVLFDQVNDLCHDGIVVLMLESGHTFNKTVNLGVDARLETRICKIVHHRLDLVRRHVAGRPENPTEDKGEVDDVAHNKADILVAGQSVEADYVMQEQRTHLFS
jgi:hypothetical protein